MDFKENSQFNDLVDKYKNLNIKDKHKQVIKLLKEDISIMKSILGEKGIKTEMLYNREILDLNSINYTEDDFAEAVFVYVYCFREMLADYIEYSEGGKWVEKLNFGEIVVLDNNKEYIVH